MSSLRGLCYSIILLALLAAPLTKARGTEGVSDDTGISDAPSKPVDEVLRTVCMSGCNFRTIQAALNSAKPGWTIQVKNGSYENSGGTVARVRNSCTPEKPCALMAFPGHKPAINVGNFGIFVEAEWWIIDGFEIKNMNSNAISVHHSHVTVRNNHVHDNPSNQTGGIAASSHHRPVHDVLIENNVVERTGITGRSCGGSPRHCHGIYISDSGTTCKGTSYFTIRRNILKEHAGAGVQIRAEGCPTPDLHDVLVENNILLNNASGFNLWRGSRGVTIRNNTVVIDSWPANTNQSGIWMLNVSAEDKLLRDYDIVNNIFSSSKSSVLAFKQSGIEDLGMYAFTLNHNVWNMLGNGWIWRGKSRKDFGSAWTSVTGWDANGKCCSVNPQFLSASNMALQPSSPARNAGSNEDCADVDFSGEPRPQESMCDVGAYEYKP